MHTPSEQEKENILKMASIMDKVRDLVNAPINVHCWIRPSKVNAPGSQHDGQNYNAFVKGATHSAHIVGKAVDWDCGQNCDVNRAFLRPHLEELNLRMENMPGGNWVHLDCAEVAPGGTRFFIP